MDLLSANTFISRTEEQEKLVGDLENQVAEMKRTADSLMSGGDLESLADTNQRLKFRMGHLQTALKVKELESATHMFSTKQKLEALFHVAVLSAYPDVEEIPNAISSCDARHGDYQCNNAMQICQWLKKRGENEKPNEIAEKLIENLPKNDLINSTKCSQVGFINLDLKVDYVSDQLTLLMRKNFPPPEMARKMRVIVDYSSPNIAKEMHVGHLRSTIIGDSIAKLLEFVGHDVLRLSHLGDWGTQFGMLIAHLQDKFPDYLSVSPPIHDLQAFYKEAKIRFDADPEFKKRAYECVVTLQKHDADSIKGWKMICDVSYREFLKVYERLNISKKLINRGESFYDSLMRDVVKELEDKDLLQLDEGRKIMFIPGFSIPLTIVKTDGGFTYDTSDMACVWHRNKVEKVDWNIYVVDCGQGDHLNTIIKAAEHVGWVDPKKQRGLHVGFGLVLGEDKKKFKTRSGATVRLVELLDEGLSRSEAKLKEKGRDKELTAEEFAAARDAVAYGCIKYADLSKNRLSDYIFSYDKMLDDRGNTAVYLLYAYTRIRAIARNAGVSKESLQEFLEQIPRVPLEHPKELKLAKKIISFQEVILGVLESLLMNQLCDFVYELCCCFTEFYDNCYCIEKERETGKVLRIHMHRLLLCEATASVMDQCFHILGIQPVAKM